MESQQKTIENGINTEFDALSRPIKMRCPDCFQLYNVSPWEIKSTRPKFECQKCSTQFWISFPECLDSEEVLAFPIEWLYPDQNPAEEKKNELAGDLEFEPVTEQKVTAPALTTKPCTLCSYENPIEQKDCSDCGVVFKKLLGLENGAPRSSYSLRKLWAGVMEDFVEDGAHSKFLKACKKENNLQFAAHKYKVLLECCPGDSKIQDMNIVVSELIKNQLQRDIEESKKTSVRKVHKLFSVWSIVYMVCAALICFGIFAPGHKNIIGIGVALFFLSLSIRHYLNKPTNPYL